LKPLGRQAEVARRANVIQSDVRDSRLRLLADDLTQMKSALEAEIADETALRERRSEVESELTAAKAREAILDAAIAESAPQVDRAQNTFYALGAQQERLRSTMALAKERVRLGETEEEEVSRGRDPEEIDREAHALRVQESELAGQVDADRLALNAAISERTSAEAALAAEDARLHAATRAVADRREGLARIAGQVAAAKSRLDARSAEIERLDERLAEARERADQAAQEFTALETQVAGMDAGELGLDSEHDESSRALADAEKELESAKLEEQEAERERAGAIARLEALEQGMARRDGGAAILAATDTMSGILGSVAALMQIENGWESAIAAALGSAADAIAVSSTDAAENAVRMLRRDDAGRAALVVVGQNSSDQSQWPTLSGSQRYAVDLISCDAELRSSLSGILQRVVVTNSLEEARQVVTANQTLRAVTRDGDLVGHGFVQGGSQGTQSLVEIQAAIDEARLKLEASAHRVDRAKFAVVGATQAQEAALVLVSNSLERLHESDASMAAIAVQLGSLQSVVRSATGEADRVAAAIASANKAREDDLRSVQELEARYAAAENDQISDSELSEESRESLVKTLEDVRQAELNVRLTVRTGEERVRALGTQAEQLEHSANLERTARARAIELRERRRREAQIAKAVVVASETALELLTQSVALAQFEREQAVATRQTEEAEVRKIRERIRELTAELEVLTDSVHRDEVARAEQRLRIEAMENKSVEDYGVGPDELLAEYGPDVMVPPSPPAPGDEVNPDDPEPEPYPYVRTQQESRLAAAERSLALLGKVNPLALEEFSALEERHKFLGEQLEDLRKSRNDLMSVIRDVDARVQEVFSQAYEDTAREFMSVFSRLFPGGEARMILTEPNDLLNSGVEIEARPPGKTYKRLSLLSGGEQSLTAVAFLIALFKSRPSPFYILDEVEAALDDVNLGRLLEILAELRTNSQLLIITHQKRTMEIADALYGVSMRGDGVTQVISQRITHDDHDNPEQRADAQMANNS
ncbi:MAG: AAA family ATPase, partial [Actinobacteria bacterium]|nr:AAA family ATPase [Actinomycetota bacterium]